LAKVAKSVASEEHLKLLRQGVAAWNEWREKNPLEGRVDLSGANLAGANFGRANLRAADLSRADLSEARLYRANLGGANLCGADLREADLIGANLSRAELIGADLSGAYLSEANLSGADLSEANFSGAKLSRADLSEARLYRANLGGANLSSANLSRAQLGGANLRATQLIETDLRDAKLTGSSVYGVSAWNIKVNDGTKQENLIITDAGQPVITVDNIKVAQSIYLLLNNQEIRDVIDTITSKTVLILGRFSEERKPILNAIRDELRKPEHNYLPIVFDFQRPSNRTTVETIKTLAHLARFVIADLTDARSVLQELQSIVPDLPSVAVRLLIKKSETRAWNVGSY
jgi:uncharacterized protein YjbI with pentapeptide repeats